METEQRLNALFSGLVQGVGFRGTVLFLASRLPVTGFVRNLEDGRVELVAEGNRKEIETLLARIRSSLGSNIRDVRSAWGPAEGSFPDFTIRVES